MYTRGVGRPEIEVAPICNDKFLQCGIIIAKQVFSTAEMAKLKQNVLVAYGPEVRAGTIVANERISVAVKKLM